MNRHCIVAYTTWHTLKTWFNDKLVIINVLMNNLHYFSYIFTQKFGLYLKSYCFLQKRCQIMSVSIDS